MYNIHALVCSCLADFGVTMTKTSDTDPSGKVQELPTVVQGNVGASATRYYCLTGKASEAFGDVFGTDFLQRQSTHGCNNSVGETQWGFNAKMVAECGNYNYRLDHDKMRCIDGLLGAQPQ